MNKGQSTTHDSILIINKKKRELAIFMIFTLAVLIILISFAIRPMLVTIARISSEIDRKKVVEQQLEEKLDNLEILRTQYYEFEEELEDLTLVFPSNWDFSLFVANIEQLCNKNNFKLLSIRLREFDSNLRQEQNLPEFNKLGYWNADITVRGRQDNLIHLFEDIESLPTYSTVDRLSYSVDLDKFDEEDDQDLLEFNVGMRIYYVQEGHFYNLFDF